ncbi:MAG: porin, partial [Chitinophagaceae bacterium]|nr:porin [Chitinophagaceae bacterium]
MKEYAITLLVFISCNTLSAQDSAKILLSFSAYAEVYYQYDFNKPADNNRPGFVYSHNRHNEF